jgi:fluoride exporter
MSNWLGQLLWGQLVWGQRLLAVLPPSLRAPIAISGGAIAGALCRYYLTVWSVSRWGNAFPYGTFGINLTGCGLMGLIVSLTASPGAIEPEWRLFLVTGFLGAYTTFSTYGLESLMLLQQRSWAIGLIYWWGSSLLGLVAVQLGGWLGQGLNTWLGRGQ